MGTISIIVGCVVAIVFLVMGFVIAGSVTSVIGAALVSVNTTVLYLGILFCMILVGGLIGFSFVMKGMIFNKLMEMQRMERKYFANAKKKNAG